MKRLALLALSACAAFGLFDQPRLTANHARNSQDNTPHWVATWGTAQQLVRGFPPATSPPFVNQTVRMIVRSSLGGRRVRVRLSQAFGASAVIIGAAHLGISSSGSTILPGSDRALTFGGTTSFRMTPGMVVISDPIDLAVPPLSDLAVSLYLPEDTGPPTTHLTGLRTTYVSVAGNFTDQQTFPVAGTTASYYWLAGVDVLVPAGNSLIVAFGDSITDGVRSTPDTNGTWPALLARRLYANTQTADIAVVNAGTSGNRLLSDAGGVSALARFDRDVLGAPGAAWVMLLEGINDIGTIAQVPPAERPRTEDLIWGLRQLVERAHVHGLKIAGGTLIPFKGATFYSEEGEAVRLAVNDWIRTSGAFDAIVDFDASLRDPNDPSRIASQFDWGDHLHPSDAGYRAMADAVDLSIFTPKGVTLALSPAELHFGAAVTNGASSVATPTQTLSLCQNGSGTAIWTATASQPWITVSPSSGRGSARLSVSINTGGLPPSGALNGTITITSVGASNAPAAHVTLRLFPLGASSPPIGAFDTPAQHASGLSGSVAVTGWALDDVEVTRVRILRDPMPGEQESLITIGNAVLVDGSRPDVAVLYQGLPNNLRAGWGLLVLTNFLPNRGNGTFTLHAIADDIDGHSTLLGSRTVTVANDAATRPFGAIDTPQQGETIRGADYANFGWVLSRGPALAHPPYGRVSVVVDGVVRTSPTGWTSRPDLSALFPSTLYPGIENALGVSRLDTTTLDDGPHTIAWIVSDGGGASEGIGSRYFTVANAEGAAVRASGFTADARGGRASLAIGATRREPILSRQALDLLPRRPGGNVVAGDGTAGIVLHAKELERLEIPLPQDWRGPDTTAVTGYLRVGGDLDALPIGSSLDERRGMFSWLPGPAFINGYDLVFVQWKSGRAAARHDVRVVLHSKSSVR